jgi:hypothetical protein
MYLSLTQILAQLTGFRTCFPLEQLSNYSSTEKMVHFRFALNKPGWKNYISWELVFLLQWMWSGTICRRRQGHRFFHVSGSSFFSTNKFWVAFICHTVHMQEKYKRSLQNPLQSRQNQRLSLTYNHTPYNSTLGKLSWNTSASISKRQNWNFFTKKKKLTREHFVTSCLQMIYIIIITPVIYSCYSLCSLYQSGNMHH